MKYLNEVSLSARNNSNRLNVNIKEGNYEVRDSKISRMIDTWRE
jgi:hypothetical protein